MLKKLPKMLILGQVCRLFFYSGSAQ